MIKKYLLSGLLISNIALANTPALDNAFTGYEITNCQSGKVLIAKNSNKAFTPASINKLFVSFVILETLGAKYKYKNTFSTNAKLSHTINGDIIFNMQQDPSFKRANLKSMLFKLHDTTINGNFITSAKTKNFLPYPPGWLWDDVSFGFATAISPYLLDQGRFKLRLSARDKINLATTIPSGVVKFDNKLYEDINSKTCQIAVYRQTGGFQLRGCMQADNSHSQYVIRRLAIINQKKYLTYWLKKYMRDLHIKLRGNIYFKQHAAEKNIIATHYSPSLELQLRHLLAQSDNVYAEAFLKKLGRITNTAGISDFQSGAFAVRNSLEKINHISLHGLRLDDGSGLSRYDTMRPDILNQLLNTAYHSTLRSTWISLLAEPARNNTSRMLHLKLARNIILHAKTGSMTGVLSLAGYIQERGHQAISFSIMINGITDKLASRRWLKHWVEHTLVTAARKQATSKYKLPHVKSKLKMQQHLAWHRAT
jgi:serine-type D-Ala-D-Ala carboxypeptidase/endopeptidase (penicillin-binding protein 4)